MSHFNFFSLNLKSLTHSYVLTLISECGEETNLIRKLIGHYPPLLMTHHTDFQKENTHPQNTHITLEILITQIRCSMGSHVIFLERSYTMFIMKIKKFFMVRKIGIFNQRIIRDPRNPPGPG